MKEAETRASIPETPTGIRGRDESTGGAPPAGHFTLVRDDAHYVLRLYVAGTTPSSARALVNVRRICEEHLRGRYELEVIDISRRPAPAACEQILAAPTLIKEFPLPLRRFTGDMSQAARILLDLDRHRA